MQTPALLIHICYLIGPSLLYFLFHTASLVVRQIEIKIDSISGAATAEPTVKIRKKGY